MTVNMKNKGKVVKLYMAFTALAEPPSIAVIGADAGFAAGLIAGALAFTVNLALLEKVVYSLTAGKNKFNAFLVQIGRFLVFGAAGAVCALLGVSAVIALGISAIAFGAGLITAALRGGDSA